MSNGIPLERQKPPYKLFLKNHQCIGDAVVMTCAIESLHRTYCGQYLTMVQTTGQAIWNHNPRITPLHAHQCHIIEMEYPAIKEAGKRNVSFMQAVCEDLGNKIGRPIPLQVSKPCLYLSNDENRPLQEVEGWGKTVICNFGYKTDFTAKYAGSLIWQEVVDHFAGRGLTFIQVGSNNDIHPRIKGCVDWIGQTTDLRKLLRLVKFATAVLTPVSMLHHIASAFDVPAVVLGGGREEQGWTATNSTRYLHSFGLLDCCKSAACWKARTVPLNDGSALDRSLCALPVVQGNEVIPRCLQMLGSKAVIAALETIIETGG